MPVKQVLFLTLPLLAFCSVLTAQSPFDSFTTGDQKQTHSGGLLNKPAGQSDGEKKTIDTLRIQTWRVDEWLGEPVKAYLDTFPLNFQLNSFPERLKTIASLNTGNLGSPFRSKIYVDQTEESPFLFLRAYEQWLEYPEELLFINTTKPYTNLQYLTTVGNDATQEEDLKIYVTANATKYLNLGGRYEVLYARGFYDHNANRDRLADVFGNYRSPRYEACWKGSYNYLENMENGGISDDRYITEPLLMSGGKQEYESTNIPVYLSDARNIFHHQQLFFNQKYHLGFEKRDAKDSLKKEFVPVTSLIHTFYLDRSQKAYHSSTANLSYYDTAYIDPTCTADTAGLLKIRNTIGLSLREGFHDWAKMGITAFIVHDWRSYKGLSPYAARKDSSDAFSCLATHQENRLWGGAELYKRQGAVLTYQAVGQLCLLGANIGDFELTGQLNTHFTIGKKPVIFQAGGFIKNLHPDYFLEHYYSNHFYWSNQFQNEYRTRLYGSLEIPSLGFNVNLQVENLTNYVFFNEQAAPDQWNGQLQVVSLTWNQHLAAGILNWDNNLVYQVSSQEEVLPLPDLSVYSNLYLKGTLSQVLLTQVGLDCRYHTSYYAPAYMPATGQFYVQHAIRVGNYPFMNVYANFRLKQARFFIQYAHVSRLFATPVYFSAPHYPMNPAVLKVGISWNFYD